MAEIARFIPANSSFDLRRSASFVLPTTVRLQSFMIWAGPELPAKSSVSALSHWQQEESATPSACANPRWWRPGSAESDGRKSCVGVLFRRV